jgi:2'-5' RNA ligase
VPERAHRLFVAIPVDAAALEACRRLIEPVRTGPAGRGARWVRTENLHLTLRFLGETPPDRVPEVAAAVREAAAGHAAFEVRLAGAGAFPSPARPRALWLGVARGAVEAGAIAEALQAPLVALGWPREERPFRPHLTVARTDAASVTDGARVAAALTTAAASWHAEFTADRVVLYRSHLRAGPPVYEVLEEALLAG